MKELTINELFTVSGGRVPLFDFFMFLSGPIGWSMMYEEHQSNHYHSPYNNYYNPYLFY